MHVVVLAHAQLVGGSTATVRVPAPSPGLDAVERHFPAPSSSTVWSFPSHQDRRPYSRRRPRGCPRRRCPAPVRSLQGSVKVSPSRRSSTSVRRTPSLRPPRPVALAVEEEAPVAPIGRSWSAAGAELGPRPKHGVGPRGRVAPRGPSRASGICQRWRARRPRLVADHARRPLQQRLARSPDWAPPGGADRQDSGSTAS